MLRERGVLDGLARVALPLGIPCPLLAAAVARRGSLDAGAWLVGVRDRTAAVADHESASGSGSQNAGASAALWVRDPSGR